MLAIRPDANSSENETVLQKVVRLGLAQAYAREMHLKKLLNDRIKAGVLLRMN